MIYPIVFIISGAFGWWTAAKRGGSLADKIQYTVVYGILAALISMFVIIIAGKMGLL